MTLFLIAAAVFGVAVLGMAIGVIVSNRRLHGTCGGLAGLCDENGQSDCDACQTPTCTTTNPTGTKPTDVVPWEATETAER